MDLTDTWFEQDLKNWTKIPGNISVNEKATIILNLAKDRLKKNEGYVTPFTGTGGFKILETKLNKFYERKKLSHVIRILESFLASGNFDFPPLDQTFMECKKVDYGHITRIIKDAIRPKLILSNQQF